MSGESSEEAMARTHREETRKGIVETIRYLIKDRVSSAEPTYALMLKELPKEYHDLADSIRKRYFDIGVDVGQLFANATRSFDLHAEDIPRLNLSELKKEYKLPEKG